MSLAALPMAKRAHKPERPDKRGPGRPKGSGPGRIKGRFVVKITEEYKAWLGALAEEAGATEADVFREAMRRYADSIGFRVPPIR